MGIKLQFSSNKREENQSCCSACYTLLFSAQQTVQCWEDRRAWRAGPLRTAAHVRQREKAEDSQQDTSRSSVTRKRLCRRGSFGKEAARAGWGNTEGFLRESISAPEKQMVLGQDAKSEKDLEQGR